MKTLLITSLLTVLTTVSCSASWGKCIDMKLQEDFNLQDYSGLWYEQARDKTFKYEKGDCQQARYAAGSQKDSVYVLNSQFRDDATGFDTISGVAKCEGPHCSVKFAWYMPAGDYRIISTDYSNYSVVYSCHTVLGVAKMEFVWILSRNTELPEALMDKALNTVKERLPWYKDDNIQMTKQGGDCKYLSVSALEQLYFKGELDENEE